MKKKTANIKKPVLKKPEKNKNIQDTSISLQDFELSDTDRKVLEFKLKYPNLKDKEIAEMLGITPEWLCKVQKKPAYIKAYEYFTSETLTIIRESKAEAARTLKELLSAKNEMVRFMAAKAFIENELDAPDMENEKEFIIQDEWKK